MDEKQGRAEKKPQEGRTEKPRKQRLGEHPEKTVPKPGEEPPRVSPDLR